MQITREQAAKVLSVIDAGLSSGVGVPEPGKMCVEAAVCYGLGLPHGDDPQCVSRALRSFKIGLNDAAWSSNEARAKGLRRLGIAQLGSRDAIDDKEFAKRVAVLAITIAVPFALRAAASLQKDEKHKAALYEAANRCEKEKTRQAAEAARAAARAAAEAARAAAWAAAEAAWAAVEAARAAAWAAAEAAWAAWEAAARAAAWAAAEAAKKSRAEARDKMLSEYAEAAVQILIEMNAPGCQFLDLAELGAS